MILLIPNVTVPSGYEYVSGTVNGADTAFIVDMIISGLCLCSCEESSSYSVVINFYDVDDTLISTVTKTVTQVSNKFILDRTQLDVDYAKSLTPSERARLSDDLKGCLNVSDIQRALDNCTIIGTLDDETMIIQTIPEFPNDNFFQTLLDNADIIQETPYILSTTPDTPSVPLNHWDKWNKLEQIFFDNFDIRTSRFKYFGLELRETDNLHPLMIIYQGVAYQTPVINILNCPTSVIGGESVLGNLSQIVNMLDYTYEEEDQSDER